MRAIEIFREEGGVSLLQKTHRLLLLIFHDLIRAIRKTWDQSMRPYLPNATANYNGVSVPGAAKRFDTFLPWYTCDRPQYEASLIRAIRQHVNRGDDAIIVGGGWGVSAVVAAIETDGIGSVTVYEGAASAFENVRRTVKANGVTTLVDVKHATVGKTVELAGSAGMACAISPDALRACDVLVLDCEGAELSILRNMTINPRRIIVESHGLYGSSSVELRSVLESGGYDVESCRVAETESLREPAADGKVVTTNLREHCYENDVFVLEAVCDDIGKSRDGGC